MPPKSRITKQLPSQLHEGKAFNIILTLYPRFAIGNSPGRSFSQGADPGKGEPVESGSLLPSAKSMLPSAVDRKEKSVLPAAIDSTVPEPYATEASACPQRRSELQGVRRVGLGLG